MIQEFTPTTDKHIDHLRSELRGIRTGRASSSLIERLPVEAYGGSTKMRLMDLSTITTEGPTMLVVVPFDPSTIPDIEKAIRTSPLGITPQTQGTKILISLPPLSQEQREKMTKIVGQKVEETKEHIRKKRDEIRKKIKQASDNKEISEDDKFRFEKDLDAKTHTVMDHIQEIKQQKEKEIMEV